jgi:hypothetical protein
MHLFFTTHVCDAKCDGPKGCRARSELGRNQRVAKAKAVCRSCPVRAECLQWALDIGLEHGVAGGLTERERTTYGNAHTHTA